MLGKQTWRLSQSPAALWSQILKGICYPNGDLWKAKIGQHPSWGLEKHPTRKGRYKTEGKVDGGRQEKHQHRAR